MTTNRSIKSGMATLALAGAVAFGTAAFSPLLANAKSENKTYTHAFRQATADEVLAWMGSQGLRVSVERADLPHGTMTFAFDGMKGDELVTAFAQMVGLQPVKRDGVYSLLRGVGGDGTAEPMGAVNGQDPCDEEFWPAIAPEFIPEPMEFDEQDFDFDFDFEFMPMVFAQDVGKIVEEVMKALEESGVFTGQKLSEAQKKALKERLHDRLGKLHEGPMHFLGPEKALKLEGQRMKEIEKAQLEMREHLRLLEKEGHLHRLNKEQIEKLKLEGKLHELNKADMEKAREAMKKAMEEMEKHRGLHRMSPEQIEELKLKGFDSEGMKKRMLELEKKLGEDMKVLQFKLENIKKFVNSLTPAQRKLADERGYLTPEDLTKEQRELLGLDGKGEVNLTFQTDGQKIVIKSKEKEKGQTTSGRPNGVITV